MRVSVLASGSKGNCICISDCGNTVMIDDGLSYKELLNRAKAADLDIGSIKAVLITHEHIDHIKGLGVFSRACGVEVYAPDACYSTFKGKVGDICYAGGNPCYENGFDIGNFSIKPFRTPHDSVYSVGYKVSSEGKSVSVVTDLGIMTDGIFKIVAGSDMVILESNHDTQMLKTGSYPMSLKRRILGTSGHLSNEVAADSVRQLRERGTQRFMLAHLSEDNNLPVLAYNESHEALHSIGADKDTLLCVAKQRQISDIIDL